jgi:hypothetical protein
MVVRHTDEIACEWAHNWWAAEGFMRHLASKRHELTVNHFQWFVMDSESAYRTLRQIDNAMSKMRRRLHELRIQASGYPDAEWDEWYD